MDYHRIYLDFIKDRRAKEPGLAGYSEKHHILPRSLGGDDDAENLIRLTPEDHFVAHLLLAKMHGGKMWAPVALRSRRAAGVHIQCIEPSRSVLSMWMGADFQGLSTTCT